MENKELLERISELDKALMVQHDRYNELLKAKHKLEHKCEVLEKALDKVCEKLPLLCEEINICKLEYCPLEHPKFGCSKCDNAGYWKEWALKEVQEDE